MSKWLSGEVEVFLRGQGALGRGVMGPGTPPGSAIDADAAKRFAQSMQQSLRLRDATLAVIVLLYVVLFSVGILLVLQYRDDPMKAAAFFGGDIAALGGVIAWLRRAWMDKAVVDMFAALADGLPADEALKFLQVLYYGRKQSA